LSLTQKHQQGDQMGRFSPFGRLFTLASFLKIKEVAQIFVLVCKLCINFDKKMGWATFWEIFLQTDLVTLHDQSNMAQQRQWHFANNLQSK
jgi:hypothetical protein